jgi:hypothetical protein
LKKVLADWPTAMRFRVKKKIKSFASLLKMPLKSQAFFWHGRFLVQDYLNTAYFFL